MKFFPVSSITKKAAFSTLMLAALPVGLMASGGKQHAATLASDSSNGSGSQASAVEKVAPNAEMLKLALKFVEYTDSSGKPVLTADAMKTVTDKINKFYAPCKIQFVAEEFHPVEPKKLGLDYNTQSMNELDPIRSQFQDNSRLVVINTGDWNHDSMGAANAWTSMPGEKLAGAVIEADVASYGGIVAHELGHYLNLDHVDDNSNMMNPIIYDSSTDLDTTQCDQMRETALKYWKSSLR